MKHIVEMGSGAMVCIPSFMETASRIEKLIWRGYTDSVKLQESTFIYLFIYLFFKIRQVG
jgi:hypothetical protein